MTFKEYDIPEILENAPQVRPSAMFRLRLGMRLVSAMNRNRVSVFSGFRILAPKAVALTAITFFLATSGITTMYAYNSPYVTRGNPLYFLKTGVEDVEKLVAFSPEDKSSVFMKMAERRAKEAEVMASEKGRIDSGLIEEIQSNNLLALNHAKSITKESTMTSTKANIMDSSTKQKESLEKIKEVGFAQHIQENPSKAPLVNIENSEAIFLSAPVAMDNMSVRDKMTKRENPDDYGLVDNTENIVISGFLPDEEEVVTEEEIVKTSPELQLVEDTLKTTEDLSETRTLEKLLEKEPVSDVIVN